VVAEIGAALKEIGANPEVRVAILTGTGDKAFVAGADIGSMAQMTALEAKRFSAAGQEVLLAMESAEFRSSPPSTVLALGGGTEIAMACDFIYASENAKFGQPEINLGIIPVSAAPNAGPPGGERLGP